MIIKCPSCDKKFEVNSELIPNEGRTIQCGSCNFVWFFNKNSQDELKLSEPNIKKKIPTSDKRNDPIISKKNKKNTSIKTDKNKRNYEITKYKEKNNFSFGSFLSYILVGIITFIGVIIVIDTFSTSIYRIFPNLELILFNLFETLKDIKLFIIDLI
jgi:predicted Zn finger-like uncharacterized protein